MKLQAFFVCGVLASSAAVAGPEKIKFPNDYLKGQLYQTLDRPDCLGLCPHCGERLSEDDGHACGEPEPDDRWSKLRELL